MLRPALLGIGTALPEIRMDNMEIYDGMEEAFSSRRAPALFRASQVESRHIVQGGLEWYQTDRSNHERMVAYIEEAPRLGIEAIWRALAQADLSLEEIDSLVVASSTGVDCPGVDVAVADALGMSPYLRRCAIVGMGCQALMPSLYHAISQTMSGLCKRVLVLTVELCTLHIQHNSRVKNILGSALFSDGASATVVSMAEQGPFIVDTLTYSDYDHRSELSFRPGDRGYTIHLSGKIPALLSNLAPDLVDRMLAANGIERDAVSHWIVHPGGMAILDSVERALALTPGALDAGRYVLRNYGNMSSATLLFVLERLSQEKRPQAGEYGIMLGFGPGMTVEAGLLQW